MTKVSRADDLFVDEAGRGRRVRGVAVLSGATQLAELAGRVGFETVWIDMEHGGTDFVRAEALCTAAELGGAAPTIRVSSADRFHILRALEVGARIVVVPMIDTAEQAAEVVRFGKFPPLGSRGFNLSSRGMGYALTPMKEAFARANAGTYLFVQIESSTAADNIEQICQVEGLDGVLVGPGDLSASMGLTGQMDNPKLMEKVTGVIKYARGAGKHAAIFTYKGALLDAALQAGCDLAYFSGDIAELGPAWSKVLQSVPSVK